MRVVPAFLGFRFSCQLKSSCSDNFSVAVVRIKIRILVLL